MKKRICIVGDSWGCGEWGKKDNIYTVLHTGLEYYLKLDGHQVLNMSQGSSSHKFAIRCLKKALESESFDIIFWFCTDPIRDLRPHDDFVDRFGHMNYAEFFSSYKNLAGAGYADMNKVAESASTLIHCIGGASKLFLDQISTCQNLIPYIPCWSELICPEYTHPDICFSEWYTKIDVPFSYEIVSELLVEKKKQDSMINFKDFFYPDGVHPNRQQHYNLFLKIKKDFNI